MLNIRHLTLDARKIYFGEMSSTKFQVPIIQIDF